MTAKPEQLPSGRYRATTYNPHAKRKGPTKTFDTYAEAFAWAQAEERRMDRAVREHGIEVARRGAPVTFAAYTATWTRGGPPSTQNIHRANARALAKVWPTQKLADISTAMVKAMLHDAEVAGLSVSTRTARLTTVRHIMQDAIAEGLRSDDPTAGIKGPKAHRSAGRHRMIRDDELDKLLTELPEWLHAAVYLSRDSGLRIAEVCGLPWYRLDLLHGRVTVSDVVLLDGTVRAAPKGGTVYTVALTPRTVAALRAHQERWPGGKRDRVFREPGKGRDLVMPTRVRDLWASARDAAGLEYPAPRWHDLRHSRGHALARAGAPIQVIQAILRHANVNTTRLYMGEVPLSEQERWMRVADNGDDQAPWLGVV